MAEGQVLPNTGTQVIDIKPGAPITALELLFGATKGTTENQGDHIADYVSAIELLDGAEVIASVSMKELIAENAFRMGQIPAHDLDIKASGTAQQSCYFLFGRYLFDPDYYLDPANYRNLQLKITTILTAGVTSFGDGTLTVDVNCHCMDDGFSAYQGYFAPKTVKTWTTTLGGTETIDMPIDFPYLMILCGSAEDNIIVAGDVSDWKLTADADKHIVFDYDTADWMLRCRSEFGLFDTIITQTIMDADVVDGILFDVVSVALLGGDEDFTIRCASVIGNRMVFNAGGQTT